MISRILFLFVVAIFFTPVFGQEGITHMNESDLASPGSRKGLCTSDSKDSMMYENYCKAIVDQLNAPCAKPLLESLHKRFLGKDKENKGFNIGLRRCDRAFKASEQSLQNFQNILVQFIASLSIPLSKQREYAGLDNFAKADNAGKKGGLFKLSDEIINDPKYECGCKNINSEGDGKPLTVNDAQLQATCATFVTLYWAEKHGTLYGGYKKGKSKNCDHNSKPDNLNYEEPYGAACIFDALQDHQPPAGGRPETKDERLAENPDLNLIEKKMKNYCDSSINENGSMHDGRMYGPATDGEIRAIRN